MRVLFIFTIFGYSLSCLGQTYSGTWTLEGDNLINSTQLSLDISPKRFFYDALGSINIPEGLRLITGTCVDANSGGITCTLLGPGAESFKLAINSDADGVLVYFQKDATSGEGQQAIFNGLR